MSLPEHIVLHAHILFLFFFWVISYNDAFSENIKVEIPHRWNHKCVPLGKIRSFSHIKTKHLPTF